MEEKVGGALLEEFKVVGSIWNLSLLAAPPDIFDFIYNTCAILSNIENRS